MEPVLGAGDAANVVLAKAVAAHGGEKAFTRWSCGKVKYRAEGSIVPALPGHATMEDTFRLPGYFKRETRMTAGGKEFVVVFALYDGAGWTKNGPAATEPTGNPFAERSEDTFSSPLDLLPYLDREVRLTRRPAAAGDDRSRVTLRAEGDGFGPVDRSFEAATGLSRSVAKDAAPPTPS